MKIMKICILGGTGFVGHHLTAQLSMAGYRVRIPTRHAYRHRDLMILPGVEILETSIHDLHSLENLMQDCQAVINLVGILHSNRHGSDFHHVHVELAQKVVTACHELGIGHLLHMSALGASLSAPSRYLRSKSEAENLVHEGAGDTLFVTSFRPSVIFGPGDSFLNRFAMLLKRTPILPLACPQARFQPVYVGDVANTIRGALTNKVSFGKRIDLCGPRTYTLHEIIAYLRHLLKLKRLILDLPDWASQLEATLLEHSPGKPFTRDNYLSLQVDNICSAQAPHCPVSMESIAPTYLGDGHYEDWMAHLRDSRLPDER